MIMLAYLVAAGYVLYRLKQTFTNKGRWFKAACWLCAPMTVLFILVLFLRLFNLGSWFLPFQTVAYLWLTAVMYAALFAVAFDALRLLAYLIKPLRKRVLPFSEFRATVLCPGIRFVRHRIARLRALSFHTAQSC